MTKLAEVFALKRQGLNLRRGAAVVTVMLVPLIILGVLHQERYWLSVSLGALFVGLCDPGVDYAYRMPRMAVFALAGAPLTALGFGLDRIYTSAWAQILAWLTGSALIIACTTIMWLARGRKAQAQPAAASGLPSSSCSSPTKSRSTPRKRHRSHRDPLSGATPALAQPHGSDHAAGTLRSL